MSESLQDQINLNLDTLELEKKTPFHFVLAGKSIQLADPNQLDWKILVEIDKPMDLLRHVLDEDAKAWLREHPVPIEKFNVLIEKWLTHFGLPALGKGAASPLR